MMGGAGPVDVDEVVRRDVRSWLIRGETSDSSDIMTTVSLGV